MTKFLLPLLLTIISTISSYASTSIAPYYLSNKKILWQDAKKPNRYYYDFNKDNKPEALEVKLVDGKDIYLFPDRKGHYQKKIIRRYGKGSVVVSEFKRIKGTWAAGVSKSYTKLSSSTMSYNVQSPEGYSFQEILTPSSLNSDLNFCRIEAPSETIEFSGINKVLDRSSSVFAIGSSCLDQCSNLIKKFNLKIESSKRACKFLFEKLAYQSLDDSVSCLSKKDQIKKNGQQISINILSSIRDSGTIDVKCSNKQKALASFSGIFSEEKKTIYLNLGDFNNGHALDLQQQFNLSFGHELFHVGGYVHSENELDITYACNSCCNLDDKLSCDICAKGESEQIAPSDYLLMTLMYKDQLGKNEKFDPYHKSLEKLYSAIQKPNFFDDFKENVSISKSKLIDSLYYQLNVHLRNPVDNRGQGKLRYSDLISEIMAKINCHDIKRTPSSSIETDLYGCEIMYLARSIPSSYCFQQKNKQSCVDALRLRYHRRKNQDQSGIGLPSNFLSLDKIQY